MPHIFGYHLSAAIQLSENIIPFLTWFTFTTRLSILRIIATPGHMLLQGMLYLIVVAH